MSADMTKHPHWAVTVEASGEEIVRLETECYGGREISDADEVAIRTAALHLLAFIGDRTFDMIECEAFHSGYEAGERDARTPHPAPVTAREAEPVAWRYRARDNRPPCWDYMEGSRPTLPETAYEVQLLYTHPPQPSETVAEALEIVNRVFQFNLNSMIVWGDDYNQAVKDAADAVATALRALSSGEASRD